MSSITLLRARRSIISLFALNLPQATKLPVCPSISEFDEQDHPQSLLYKLELKSFQAAS